MPSTTMLFVVTHPLQAIQVQERQAPTPRLEGEIQSLQIAMEVEGDLARELAYGSN